MREIVFPRVLVALIAASILAGCQPFQRKQRIALHADTYGAASASIQELIAEGRVRRGMNKREVYLALGVPENTQREVGSRDMKEEWTYQRQFEGDYTLLFRRGALYHIKRHIEKAPSPGAVAARNRLLESLTFDDIEPTEDAFESPEEEEEGGSVAGTVLRRISSGTEVAVAEHRVTLLPHCDAWAEAETKIQENRKLRSGIARYATFGEVGKYIESLTPSQLVLRQRTDEDGCFQFSQVSPGEWMLTADYNDEDGLHLWWVVVSISSGSETTVTLNNENLTASYSGP